MSLRNVSTLKGPSSGSSATDTFKQKGQQNGPPDVKLNMLQGTCGGSTPRGCPLIYNTFNFTSGNSLCWPCCWNISIILHEPGPSEGRNMLQWHSVNNKGKAIPLQAWGGSQISRQSAHEGGKAVSPTHRPPLPPRKYSWYSFLLEAESTPGS